MSKVISRWQLEIGRHTNIEFGCFNVSKYVAAIASLLISFPQKEERRKYVKSVLRISS